MKILYLLSIITMVITACSISKSSDLTLNNQLNNQTTSTNDISGNKDATSTPILSYADVVNKNSLFDKSEVDGSVKTSYVGKKIQWQAKIASSLTRRDGIKFCIIDDKHQNVDSGSNCDWFWLYDKNLDTKDGPNFFNSANWFDYIFRTYSNINPQKIDWDKDIFLVTGEIDGVDGVFDKPIPLIIVSKIKKL